MPRVSEEHLERRRQQIVDAAQRCFARRGFHQSSMQDVFAESGLSAGAVYRYFKSKDELVAALDEGWLPADTDLDAVAAVLFGLLPGFLLQFLIVGDLDPRTLERGVRALLPYGPA